MNPLSYLGTLLLAALCSVTPHISAASSFKSQISAIPLQVQKKMKQYSWHQGCPVPLQDLRFIHLTYWGFDKKTHGGVLIVNKALAKETVSLFKALYFHHVPIQQMQLIDEFKGNDEASMAANNTSAFNCRAVTGQPGLFSQHSYGRAIDINPQINPYVSPKQIIPASSAVYMDRATSYPGLINKTSFIYTLFKQNNWDWGGSWHDVQDYQHFEKRANGEKRNPYGYNHQM